ncbi:MAG: hypothetical protein AAFQ63_22690 [Cyanobacteria bacterium J06621_11]
MLRNLFLGGAIALIASTAVSSSASAQVNSSVVPSVSELSSSLPMGSLPMGSLPMEQERHSETAEIAQVNAPDSPRRRDEIEPLVNGAEESTAEESTEGAMAEAALVDNSVDVFFRFNTELFVNGGDLIEVELPIRYSPSDRLSMQASPVIKYFPENAEENFDYGFKFAVEYQL